MHSPYVLTCHIVPNGFLMVTLELMYHVMADVPRHGTSTFPARDIRPNMSIHRPRTPPCGTSEAQGSKLSDSARRKLESPQQTAIAGLPRWDGNLFRYPSIAMIAGEEEEPHDDYDGVMM